MTTGRINQVTTESRSAPAPRHRALSISRFCIRLLNAEPNSARTSFASQLFRCPRQISSMLLTAYFDDDRSPPIHTPQTPAFFCSPPEHSLRGRNIQDGRVRIEARPVRIYRSELYHCHDRSPETHRPSTVERLSAGDQQ